MISLLENKNIIIWITAAILFYLLLKSMGKRDREFEKEYNEILYSDKYKAKGQYQ